MLLIFVKKDQVNRTSVLNLLKRVNKNSDFLKESNQSIKAIDFDRDFIFL